MLASRLLVRRSFRLSRLSSCSTLRSQHIQSGPHKEYFQNPSQYPSNFEPSRLSHELLRSAEHAGAKSQSLLLRATRTTSLVVAFLCLGFLSGTALVSWEYIQPPFERGSEEYEDLQEEIEEILETSPLVEDFRAKGWHEDPAIPPAGNQVVGSKHFLHDTLSGVQGLTVKHFRRSELGISALVFFAGFGVEGWADVLHGGAIMSIMQEAKDRDMEPMLRAENLTREGDDSAIHSHDFTFVAPLRPGEIYVVLVLDSEFGAVIKADADRTDSTVLTTEYLDAITKADRQVYMAKQLLLASMDEAPEVILQEANQHEIDMKNGKIHATAATQDSFDSPALQRRRDESATDYEKRANHVIEALVKKWRPWHDGSLAE